eukprot:911489-Pyramimonas_sp.AAC.1
MGRVKLPQATAGSKVGAIWRTGLLTGAAHGIWAPGVPDSDLKEFQRGGSCAFQGCEHYGASGIPEGFLDGSHF